MKQLLITIAAVVLVGCGESQQSATAPEAKPESATVKVPDISIHEAAEDGNIEAVKQRLAAGTDVNEKDRFQSAPLHYAVYEGHKEIAELLITKGADVNAKDEYGRAPLHQAALAGHKEIAELLIAKGADVNAKDNDGETPLDPVARDETEIADLLRKHGGKFKFSDLIGVDEDGDGFDAYDEEITNHSDNDPDDKPTQEEVDAVLAELEAVYE